MRVLRIDAERGLALCADEEGTRSTVEIELVSRSPRETRARARRAWRWRELARGSGVRFVDEFRDAELGRALAGEILEAVEAGRHYKVMEVCGGHTHSIYKYGIDDLLPGNVELVHGPGCPVCVIPMGRVDNAIALARTERSDPHLLPSPTARQPSLLPALTPLHAQRGAEAQHRRGSRRGA